ncbi:MAG: S-methyl-5'-thioadenosine phosphorylase [Thermaerobacterales bacterium]
MELAIIGGTGVYDPQMLTDIRTEEVSTPYGEAKVTTGTYQGQEIAFLPRHGTEHSVPPHGINYRANIWALACLGVRKVLATNAVGSLRHSFAPGDLVLCDQFLDFTHGRAATFFEGGREGVIHMDVSDPYCPDLRKILFQTGTELGLRVHNGGTYVCTQGPRFETPAEIRMFDRLGGDLVGMTSVPEVVLAREAGLCYTSVGMVTNFAAGITGQPLTHQEVLDILQQNSERLRKLIMNSVTKMSGPGHCKCGDAQSPIALPGLADPKGEN